MGIESWSTTAASNNSASPNGAPEGMAPSGVNDTIRQNMASVRSWYEDAQWVNLGYTHTYVGATQFKISGSDVTASYVVGRRVRAVGSSTGTIYGSITVSAFSTDTTVTVAWDSGSLSNESLTVSLGLLSPTGGVLYPYSDSMAVVAGSSDATKKIRFEVDGLTTATTRVITVPDASFTMIGADTTETLTNKTWNGATIGVAYGGTGATSLTANNVILGNGTSSVQFVAPGTSGNILQSNGTTWASVAASLGKIGQVQSTTKTSTTSTTSDSFTDITGMSVSITPTSTSSKVLVVAMVNVGVPVGDAAALKLVRNSTDIGIGDSASNRVRATAGVMSYNADKIGCVPIVFVDSPSTTSATTYKLQWKRRFASGTIYLNRSADDTDSSSYERTASTITAIEILP